MYYVPGTPMSPELPVERIRHLDKIAVIIREAGHVTERIGDRADLSKGGVNYVLCPRNSTEF
jgi:hypothetical protein